MAAHKDTLTLTFRTDRSKRDALDAIGKATDRDRSYLLNQAVDHFIELHRWQIAHIEEGQRQARAGDFVSEADWRAAFDRNR